MSEKPTLEEIKKGLLSSVKASKDGIADFEKQIEKLEKELDVLKNSESCLESSLYKDRNRLEATRGVESWIKSCEEKNWDYSDGYDRLINILTMCDSELPHGVKWHVFWNMVFQSYQEDIEIKYAFS